MAIKWMLKWRNWKSPKSMVSQFNIDVKIFAIDDLTEINSGKNLAIHKIVHNSN